MTRSAEMTEPTDELRKTVRRAIMEAEQANGDSYHIADAAIAAYQQHPDGAAADRALAAIAEDAVAQIALIRESADFHKSQQCMEIQAQIVKERDEAIKGAALERRTIGRALANKAWLDATARAEKAEAERDEARARFNDKDLCMNGQAPCEDLLAAERTAYTAGWIAGRDAAADEIDCGCDHRKAAVAGTKSSRYGVCRQSECLARLAADIRALTPPETEP